MKSLNWLIITVFFWVTVIGPVPEVRAQTIDFLPPPGTMVNLSNAYIPLQLKGIQVYPKDPLRFDFLIDKGESGLTGQALNDEVTRMTKYFLTCLTVPETDVWVNLSPYEKNRIAPENFGITQMGKDLLEQDYLLKQITASLSYPDRDLGRRFWLKMYEKAYKLYGTTNVPVNTYNKVWIVPKSADVYVHGNSAFVAHSELDVMLDVDYLALRQNLDNTALGLNRVKNQDFNQYSQLYTQVVREMILPALRKEVNTGKNFAVVRQVFQAMILATWYKRHLKNSFLGKMYVGKNKVTGVDVDDKNIKEKIFQQYLRAFKKKAYDYIKEDYNPLTQETVPRKYVSGGFDGTDFGMLGDTAYKEDGTISAMKFDPNLTLATINASLLSNGQEIVQGDQQQEKDELKAFDLLLASIVNGQSDLSDKKGEVLGSVANSVLSFLRTGNRAVVRDHIRAYQILLERSYRVKTSLSGQHPTATEIVSGKTGNTYTGNQRRRIVELLDIMKTVYLAEDPLNAIDQLGILPFNIKSSNWLSNVAAELARHMAIAQDAIEATRQQFFWEGNNRFSQKLIGVEIVDQISKENPEIAVKYNRETRRIEIGKNALSLNQFRFTRLLQKALREAYIHRMARALGKALGVDIEAQEQMEGEMSAIAAKGTSLSQFILFWNMSDRDQFTFENVMDVLALVLEKGELTDDELAELTGQSREEIDDTMAEGQEDLSGNGLGGTFQSMFNFLTEHRAVAVIPIALIAVASGALHAADFQAGGPASFHPGGVELPQAGAPIDHQPLVLQDGPFGLGSTGADVKEIGHVLMQHVLPSDIQKLAGNHNILNHGAAYPDDFKYMHRAVGIIQGANIDIQKGVYSQNVRNAVVAFQHAHGLAEDGWIGPQVITVLNSLEGVSTSAAGPGPGAGGTPPGGGPPKLEVGAQAAPFPTAGIQPQATAPLPNQTPQALPAADIAKPVVPMETTPNSMSLAKGIDQLIKITDEGVDLNNKFLDAQQNKVDTEKWMLRLYLEGGAEGNPMLRYIGLALEFRTPLLVHPTKAHDARQKPIDDALAKAAKDIKVRGNIFDFIAAVKKYSAITAHIGRLESAATAGLEDEIARGREEKRHQLAVITSMLVIPLEELPAGSNIDITDAQIDLGHIEAAVNAQGVQGQQQALQAGLAFQTAVEGVRGNLEVSQRSNLSKARPSHFTVHINPTHGTTGAGLVGWLIGFVTPEWKVFSPFDPQAQADAIKNTAAVWQDARLTIYRQLKQTLLELRKNQIDLKAAQEAWNDRGNEADPEKLVEMSAKMRDLEENVEAGQLSAMNMGIGAALVEHTDLSTEESLIKDAQDLVERAFHQGVEDMDSQVKAWEVKLGANHKDKKKVPVVLEAVKSIAVSMQAPLSDNDISGLPVTDATGAVTAASAGFTLGLPSPIVSYTGGVSSNSPDAPTFINGINEGVTYNPVFKKGGSKETKDWERQMKFSQEQSAQAQGSAGGAGGEGAGPKEFRQAIYDFLTSSLAQEIVAAGQGFNVTPMLLYMRSTTVHDSYSVFSLPSLDPMHLLMKGISKLRHKTPQEDTSAITAGALTEEFKMRLVEAMFQAQQDPAKGPNYQAWEKYINGGTPFISTMDSKGVPCNEFTKLLDGLRPELKPLWEKGPAPGVEPLEIRLMRLHLATAEKLSAYGPDSYSYFSALVVVWVGDKTGENAWEGLRSGLTINRADKKRAAQEMAIQIARMKEDLDRKVKEWERAQAEAKAGPAAKRALDLILARQPEENPVTIQAPEAQWPAITNAVFAAQPIQKELVQAIIQGKDNPRTIIINILASLQLHPTIAQEMLGGISIPLLRDWVHRASIEEINDWVKSLQYQAKVDGITEARGMMDLLAQQKFTRGDFQKADEDLKLAFARYQAINQALAEGLYTKGELDKVTQVLQRAKKRYLLARTKLEASSGELALVFSVLGDQKDQQTKYGINRESLPTVSTPVIDLREQDPDDFAKRLREREIRLTPKVVEPPLALAPIAIAPSPAPAPIPIVLQPWENPNIKGQELRKAVAQELHRLFQELPAYQHTVDEWLTILRDKDKTDEIVRKEIPRARDFIKGKRELQNGKHPSEKPDQALLTAPYKGGVDMNGNLLELNEHIDRANASVFDEKALELIPIDGVVPRVVQLVGVTPGMLKTLLGED